MNNIMIDLETMGKSSTGAIVANGATFDNVILSNAYSLVNINRPWSYKNDRCYRTIIAQHPEIPYKEQGTAHNAVDDAISQALHLIKCWEAKREYR